MTTKTAEEIKFLVADAAKYVETLEKEMTKPAAQNAYHALVRLYMRETENETEKVMNALIERYNAACNKVNDIFPS